jgi:hypothetical protein
MKALPSPRHMKTARGGIFAPLPSRAPPARRGSTAARGATLAGAGQASQDGLGRGAPQGCPVEGLGKGGWESTSAMCSSYPPQSAYDAHPPKPDGFS